MRLRGREYPKLKRWFDSGLEIDEKSASDYLWLKYRFDKASGVVTAREKFNNMTISERMNRLTQ